MRLTFLYHNLVVLRDDAIKSWPHGLVVPEEGPAERGYILVGDEGVYLLHNAIHRGGERTIIYAEECNPIRMPFDDWWYAKGESFGHDDGTEFIPANIVDEAVESHGDLIVLFTEETVEYIVVTRTGKH